MSRRARLLVALALPIGAAHFTTAHAQEALWQASGSGSSARFFGADLALAGDLNGDGVRDVLVAEPHYTTPGGGVVHGIDGATGATLFSLPDPTGTAFGENVRSLGSDANGDGVEEFFTVAGDSAARTSTVLLYSGGDRALLRTIVVAHPAFLGNAQIEPMPDLDADGLRDVGVGFPGTFAIHSSASGALIRSFSRSSPRFGLSSAPLDDVNYDGWPDLLLADSTAYGMGAIFVYSLFDGSKLREITGTASLQYFGRGIAALGDVDQDGATDFVVGADRDATHLYGVVTLFSGATGTPLDQLLPPPFVPVHSPMALVGDAGDVDGDGVLDFAVMEHVNQPPFGYATWVASGRTFERLVNLNDAASTSAVGVAWCDDLDGDGFGELLTALPPVVTLYRGGPAFLSAERCVVALPASGRRWKAGSPLPPPANPGGTIDSVAFVQAAGFAPNSLVTLVLLSIDGHATFTPLAPISTNAEGGWFAPFPFVPNAAHDYVIEAIGVDASGQPLVTPPETIRFIET